MVNGIVSLISLSNLLLIVYRNIRNCYSLIFFLYPTILSNSLMSTSSFLVASLRFSMSSMMSSANSESFASFPIGISFISVSSWIAMAISSKAMLNKSGESRHP